MEFLEEGTSARDRICSFPGEILVRLAVSCVVDAKIRKGKKTTELIVLTNVPATQYHGNKKEMKIDFTTFNFKFFDNFQNDIFSNEWKKEENISLH